MSSSNSISEEELILNAQRSPAGFSKLYDLYHNRIFLFVLKRVEDEASAADITSDVFVKVFTNIRKFKYRGFSIASWIFRIAINEMNTYFKIQKKTRVISIEKTHIGNILQDINEQEESKFMCSDMDLANALSKLSDDALTIIELRFFEQLPFKQISAILGITETNAKVKVYRILKKIKSNLEHGK